MPDEEDAPVEVPLTDVLDLHAFAPRDIAELVQHYVDECHARGWRRVRIIHGKGTGAQRRTVLRVLEKHPQVVRYQAADETSGGWGATMVELRSD